jgi:hypothetical protein
MKFVFLHVGEDVRPYFLVKSIRRFFPKATIIQCTDLFTKEVEGVDHVFRHSGDINNLMTFRLEAFYLLNIEDQAIYLDTDMLILKHFDLENYKNYDAVLCKRSFDLDALFNYSFRGMDLSEYKNKTINDVYPFLACFTLTSSSNFWKEAYNILKLLNTKFHYWYGDQEAIKNIVTRNIFNICTVDESSFACLPEKIDQNSIPNIAHFKGPSRKSMMFEMASKMELT